MATILRQFNAGLNKVLTNVALGRKITGGECKRLLFPDQNVNDESGAFTVGGFESFIPLNTRRAIGGDANFADETLGSDSYDANEEQIAYRIDTRAANAARESLGDLERHRTQLATDQINKVYNVDACTVATTAASYAAGFTFTPGTKWDAAGGTPINDILTGMSLVAEAGEGVLNRACFGNLGWAAFSVNEQIISLWNQAGMRGPIDPAQFQVMIPQIMTIAIESTVSRTPAGANSFAFDSDGVVLGNVADTLPSDAMTSSYGATLDAEPLTVWTWEEQGGRIKVVSVSKIGDVKLLMLDGSSDTRVGIYITAVDS